MGNSNAFKQMMALHKTSFKNCFSIMLMYQNQAEKLIQTLVNCIPEINDDSKKIISQWGDVYKQGFENLRKAVDELTDIHKKSCENFSKQVDESIRCMENFKPAEKGLKTDTKKKKLTP